MVLLALFAQYVTCVFYGQLGNQLFQAAAAIGYALDHDCEAIFPDALNALNGELNCRYVFHRLDIAPLPAQIEFHLQKENHSNIYQELTYTPGENVILRGHFESDRYFLRHQKVIRELFAPSPEVLSQIYEKYGDLLAKPHTVAVHVRTFIPDGRNPLRVGIGGAHWLYFVAAMQHFPKDAHFLVFSDAMDWTESRFPSRGKNVTFIKGNPHYIDFYLMSLCENQIVSPESTFSWWAAWLNKNPDKKIVIADVWNGLLENDTIPDGWIKLSKNPWR